jgi:hypothetical protein
MCSREVRRFTNNQHSLEQNFWTGRPSINRPQSLQGCTDHALDSAALIFNKPNQRPPMRT